MCPANVSPMLTYVTPLDTTADHSIPGHHVDERGSLAGLSGLFDKLMEGSVDPARAVKLVVALLAGDAAD